MDVPARPRRPAAPSPGPARRRAAGALAVCLIAPAAATAQDVTVPGGSTRTTSTTETVDDFTVDPGGTAVVTGAGFLTTDAFADQGTVDVQAGGRLDAASLAVSGGGQFQSAGDLNVAGAASADGAGTRFDVTGGTFDADSFALTGGAAATVAGTATLDTLTLTDGTLTVDGGGLLDLLALNQAAAGGLNVRSGGVVRVNGDWTGGVLFLNQGGTFAGNTNFVGDVIAAGTLAPGPGPGTGPGTMTVAGAFLTTPTAVLDVEVGPAAGGTPVGGTDFDRIVVAGAATINGGTLRVSQFAPGTLVRGTRYDVLVADRLTVNDPLTLENVTGYRFVTRYDATTYTLVVGSDTAYAGLGTTFNRRGVGTALDAAGANPALAGLFDALDTLPSDAAAAAALDQLAGSVYGTHLSAVNRSSLNFLDVIGGRDAALPLHCRPFDPRGRADGLGGWQESYGTGGRINGDGNAAAATLGTFGTAVGLTRTVRDGGVCVELEAFYGYESATARVPGDGPAGASVTSDLHRVGGSLRASAGRTYGRLTGFGGVSDAAARRGLLVDSPEVSFADATAATFDGTLAGADAELGRLYGTRGAYLMPVAGLRYVHAARDGFTEAGGPAALTVEDASLSALRARLGVRAGRRVSLAGGLPAFGTLEAFYSRDVSAGTTGGHTAAFAAAPDATFAARGTDFGADRVLLGPGLTFGDGPVRFATNYRAGLGEDSVLHTGDVRFEVRF